MLHPFDGREQELATLRAAIDAIAEMHPELSRHLRCSVDTGVVCVYEPESLEEWQIKEPQ